MNLTNPRVAATQFQVYMALLNVKDAWTQKVADASLSACRRLPCSV